MNKLIANTLSTIVAVGLFSSSYALAEEPTQFDYTGLPIEEAGSDTIEAYTTIPASQRMPECEVVVDHFDYTGDDVIRCNPGVSEPEAEWSYLY